MKDGASNQTYQSASSFSYSKFYNAMQIYIPHISQCPKAVYDSSVGRERMSVCKGTTGSCYQSMFDLTYPPNPGIGILD